MTRDELLDKFEDIEYWQEQYAGKTFLKALHSVVELHSEAKAEPTSYCKGCSVLGVLTIAWPCPTITVIDRMMK